MTASIGTDDAFTVHSTAIIIDGVVNAAFNRGFFLDLKAGGYTAAIVTVAMPFYGADRVMQALSDFAQWEKWFAENEDVIRPIRSAADIRAAKRDGRVGIIHGMQDGGPYSANLELLRVYRKLGLRISSLCYNQRNLLADGCVERANAGLSAAGRQAVEMLNELGIVLDLSHVGYRSALEALEASRHPVVLSHSNALAMCDNPRNVPDELLDAVANSGGVIGVSPLPMLLSRKKDRPKRSIEQLFDHIDYVVKRVGIDHVGYGSDIYKFTFDDAVAYNVAGTFLARLRREPVCSEEDIDEKTLELRHPAGIDNVRETPNITSGLLARGYPPADIRKILGENFLRVFEQVWCD